MPVNLKVSELTALTTPDAADLLPIVDVSDTTDAASGTTKKITHANLVAGLGGGGAATIVASTVTGAQNNYAPTLSDHTLIEWSGASDAAFTGIAGGSAGMIVTFKNTGTKIATFAHNSGSSSAGNKLFNIATSAPTPVAAGGYITYQHDGTQWQLVAHEQGAWITPTFAAGNYTSSSGTWVVESGDVAHQRYRVSGTSVIVLFQIFTTTITGTPSDLYIGSNCFGGFSVLADSSVATSVINDAGTVYSGYLFSLQSTNKLRIGKYSGNFTNQTNTFLVYGSLTFPVS